MSLCMPLLANNTFLTTHGSDRESLPMRMDTLATPTRTAVHINEGTGAAHVMATAAVGQTAHGGTTHKHF